MIFDMQTLFSDAQAITATAVSTNVVQIGHAVNAPGDAGAGGAIPMLIQVVEDFNTLTSLDVAVQVDSTEGFGSPKTVMTVNVLLADLVAGKQIAPQYVPQGADEAFMRLNFTVVGTPPTTGKITAGITYGNQTNG